MAATVRVPHPSRVVWSGTAAAPNRVDWLVVDELGGTAGDLAFRDPNPMMPPGRLRLGVTIDQGFTGTGVKIETVADESAAAKAGIVAGDVLVALDETEVEGIEDLRRALAAKKHGDRFEVIVRRGEEGKVLEGRFPDAKPRAAFARRAPAGTIEIERHGQAFSAWTSGVRRFSILLSADAVDLGKPIRVTVNGLEVHDAVVKPDPGFLVTQALADEDRRLVYSARVTIGVPGAKN